VDGIVDWTERFLTEHDGKRRISVDSITELVYYTDEDRAHDAVRRMLDLLAEHDAVGVFHLSTEVHDGDTIDRFRSLFDGAITLDEEGRTDVSV